MHSYISSHYIWTISWLGWKTLFVKLHNETFFSAKFDNDMSTIFIDNPDRNILLLQNLLECIHSYSSSHSIWTSFWLDWKSLFVKLHSEAFMSAKFDNDMSTFFHRPPWLKFFLLRNLPGCIHPYSSPHSIWTSYWLDWKTLFVELQTETFLSAKFDNDMITFPVDNPIHNILLLQILLECIHSYSSSHSIWTSFWLDWKSLFVKLHSEAFMSAKFDNDMSTFFHRSPWLKFFSASEPSRMYSPLL